MREIEFRGKRKDNNEWIYGTFGILESIIDEHINYYYIVDCYGDSQEIIPETIGQYTGLKDKNGAKIFEGDIVKLNNQEFIIMYKNNAMSFVLRPVEEKFIYDFLPVCVENNLPIEAIGNIFDKEE
jgi:uncharacterized phage protein (TIGR01671 family)